MIVQNKTLHVLDVEVLINCFTCRIYNTETKESIAFEFSERKLQNKEFIEHMISIRDDIMVGYNINHYDRVIINYILLELGEENDYKSICSRLKALSDATINKGNNTLPFAIKRRLNRYKYANLFKTLDLATMLFSRKLMASLKALQITMGYHNVQEMVIDWNSPIPVDRIDELHGYNENDVMATNALLEKSVMNIEIREHIREDYGIDCLSLDDVNTGVAILKKRYVDIIGKEPEVPIYTDDIKMTDIILDGIEFKSKEMKSLLEQLKQYVHVQKYHKDGEEDEDAPERFKKQFLFNGQLFSFGIGGLHTLNKAALIIPDENQILRECDAQSLYPNMILNNGCTPRHLGKEFELVYQTVLDERLVAKSRKKEHIRWARTDTTLKFALNGITGNMGNKYSWLFDPQQVLKIRINGQLLFLMLVERLVEIGCTIVSANTDGINALIPKDKEELYFETCREWEKFSKLTLEYDDFEKIVMIDVNNYLAVESGFTEELKINGKQSATKKFTKAIGSFVQNVYLGKGLTTARVIPKAITNYFLFGEPIEDTIYGEKEIMQFIMSQKPTAKFSVAWGEHYNIQLSNRYYVSQKGNYLIKYVDDVRNGIEKIITQPVMLINNFSNVRDDIREMDIYYPYYLSTARTIIESIETKQLSLF